MNPTDGLTAGAPASESSNDGKKAVAPAENESIFAHAGFNKLFFGSLAGAFADRLYFAALIAAAYIIYDGQQPENYKGRIQIYATIPLLILYGFAGSLVDTQDRRKILTWVKRLKVFVVLAFIPLLWKVVDLDPKAPDGELRRFLIGTWPWWIVIITVLNVLTVPFGPARAAAIPDVVPERHRSLGASLMATSGLIALMLAAGVGAYLARTDKLGPALTIVVSSLCYLLSSVLFAKLPDAVAVPGNQRRAEGVAAEGASKLTVAQHLQSLWDGVKYCLSHGSVLGLIFFECVFWTAGSAYYLLIDFHARTVFHFSGNELSSFSGNAFVVMGVGIIAGAMGVGRICSKVSPIATYTPAFILLAGGLYGIFRAPMVDGGAPDWIYPLMFCVGLGGGSLLGRVDADVLAVTDPRMRGRVFSIKALAFAATILTTIIYLSEGASEEQKLAIALWLPRAFLLMLPLAMAFSWVIDVGIWAQKPETQLPGALHRFGYLFIWILWRTLNTLLFRMEVKGLENLPKTGPVVLAANHASFIDPLLLGSSCNRHVQWIMYSSYYRGLGHPIFRFLRCIPVDERGGTAALKAGMRSLKQGACIGIFPEGRVSADGKLQPPQGGVLFLAQRSGAPVVPVALKGNYAAFPRSAWFPRPLKITVIYGKPFVVGKELSREQAAALTDQLMVDLAKMLEVEPPLKVVKAEEAEK